MRTKLKTFPFQMPTHSSLTYNAFLLQFVQQTESLLRFMFSINDMYTATSELILACIKYFELIAICCPAM